MRKRSNLWRSNLRHAKKLWGVISAGTCHSLRHLTWEFSLSIANGDLQLFDGRWYVTHSGLLALAARRNCAAITTSINETLSEPAISRWVVKATVYKDGDAKGFDGYGDACPGNVTSLVTGAELRIAETRAVNRALRKAYGIGLCSVEELGSSSFRPAQTDTMGHRIPASNGNGRGNGHSNVRDRLCLLIRKYDLDPAQVKKYAGDFCGTQTLRDAGREPILEPREFAARSISGRLYCTAKALWRLNWFLRDFGYDTDLLGREEVDEKNLIGLRGVIRTIRRTFARRSFLNLDSFAPSGEWQVLSGCGRLADSGCPERSSDDLQLHTD